MLVVVSPFSSLLTNCRRIVSQDGNSANSVSGAGPSTVNSSSLDASSVRLINSFIWYRTQRSRTSGTKRKRASTVSPLSVSRPTSHAHRRLFSLPKPSELPKDAKRVKMMVTPMTPNKKAPIATKKTPPARPKATKTRPPQAQGTRWSSRLHRKNTESETGDSSAEELEPVSYIGVFPGLSRSSDTVVLTSVIRAACP
jgi:hypothetical protein